MYNIMCFSLTHVLSKQIKTMKTKYKGTHSPIFLAKNILSLMNRVYFITSQIDVLVKQLTDKFSAMHQHI